MGIWSVCLRKIGGRERQPRTLKKREKEDEESIGYNDEEYWKAALFSYGQIPAIQNSKAIRGTSAEHTARRLN